MHYFVNSAEFSNHPVIGAEFAKEGIKVGRVEEVATEGPETAEKAETNTKSKGKSSTRTRKVVRGKGKKQGPALKKFEDTVDRIYTQDLYAQCRNAMDRKERAKDAEIGIFGIGTDWQKVKKIEAEVIRSCEELKRLGVLNR